MAGMLLYLETTSMDLLTSLLSTFGFFVAGIETNRLANGMHEDDSNLRFSCTVILLCFAALLLLKEAYSSLS